MCCERRTGLREADGLVGKLNLLALARQGKPSRCGDVIGHNNTGFSGWPSLSLHNLFSGIARRNVIEHQSIQLGSPPFDKPFM